MRRSFFHTFPPRICTRIIIPMLLLGLSSLQAQTIYNGPDNGSWFDSGHWSAGLPAAGNPAVIPGGKSVLISGIDLDADFNIDNFGTITLVNASLINGTSLYIGGSLINQGNIINQGNFSNFGSLTGPGDFINKAVFVSGGAWTIPAGSVFTNESSANVNATGSIACLGTILNQGVFGQGNGFDLQGTFNNASGATFNNNFGSDLGIASGAQFINAGNISNGGIITNAGVFQNTGIITNNVTFVNQRVLTNFPLSQWQNFGTVTNQDSLYIQAGAVFQNQNLVINTGVIQHAGTIDNNNQLDNQSGSRLNIRPGATLNNAFGSQMNNQGVVVNESLIAGNGAINNAGSLTSTGTIQINIGAVVGNTGTWTNQGTLTVANTITNQGTLVNAGEIQILSGGILNNHAVWSNQVGAVVSNDYEIYQFSAAVLNNAGILHNKLRFFNEGNIVNNGFVNCPGDWFNRPSGVITNNELIEIAEGNLKNEGNVTNNKTFRINACSSLRNSGTVQNNHLIQNKGLVFQFGTIAGNAIQQAGGYIHTNAASSTAPVCQPVTVSANFDGEAKVYANAMISLGNSNNCNSLIYLANGDARPVWHCSEVGTIQIAHVVIRTRLNDSLTCQSNITVVDSLAPVFDQCPRPISILSATASLPVNWTAPTATDNCTSVTLTTTHQPGSTFQAGTTAVTYTATDLNGRSNQCQFTVHIQQVAGSSTCSGDNTVPVIANCPANQTIYTPGFSGSATWQPPTATDNCYPVILTTSASPGTTFQLGSHQVVYTATDGANNATSCVFTINIVPPAPCTTDIVKPVLSGCPTNQFILTNPNINGAYAIWSPPSASDNCGPVTLISNRTPGTYFSNGTTQVVYTATDQSGNSHTCQFNVTVSSLNPCPGDQTGPVFSACPTSLSLTTTGSTAVANWTAPTASDACSPVTVNANYLPGTAFPVGVTVVQYQASDLIGNANACTFQVTVQNACDNDQINPVITGCPSNIFIATPASASVATWTAPTASDNCTLQSFSSNYGSGVTFPVGTTFVVYTATDARGNIANCNFSVTVANAPGCTTNTLPANGAADVNPTSVALSWSPAANATSYDIYLSTASTPTTLVGSNISSNTFTVNLLQGGATYYWYVVPRNGAGPATGCTSGITKFVTATYTCNVCTGNLLTNGCFNDGFNGYTVTNGSLLITNTYAGPYAAAVCGSSGSLSATRAATPGMLYKWSTYARVTEWGICANMTMRFLNSSGSVISTAPVVSVTSTSYQLYTVQGVAPEGTASVRITIAKCGSAGCVRFDEMCLTAEVYCNNVTSGGTITGGEGTSCGPYDAPLITSTVLPSGGSGTIEYVWRSSTTGCPSLSTGLVILGANGSSYDPPQLLQTTSFIRLAKRSGCVNYVASNCVTYTVTADNVQPVIDNCPAGQSIVTTAGCATATWITPTATDNCGTPFLQSNYNSGFCFPVGSTTVIYTASDAAGNSKTCTFAIAVGSGTDAFCKGTPGTGLTREVWNNISGSAVSNLTSHANFPNNPTSVSLNAASTGPVNIADNYGTRVRGYITPPTTGNYKFYVYGDDETQLFLSTNHQSGNKILIAHVPGWTNVAQLNKYSSQASVNKYLTAGQDYYVEVLQKEAGGGDHWGVYWIPPGSTTPVAIPLTFLAPVSINCCVADVLYVVGSTTLNSGDQAIYNRLTSAGHTVILKSQYSVQTSDATGKDLVLISSTVNSTNIGSKFRNVTIPVMCYESNLFDDMKMTNTSSGYDYGVSSASKTEILLSHPLTVGVTGTVSVFTGSTNNNWGKPSSSAIKAAKIPGSSYKYQVFGYETGAQMSGLTAPARRIGFFLEDANATMLTANGWKLFDNAVKWALACNTGQGLVADIPDEISTLEGTDAISDHDKWRKEADKSDFVVHAYPNPVSDRLFISLEGFQGSDISMHLCDINGKIIYEQRNISADQLPMEIDTRSWSSGFYILYIQSNRQRNDIVPIIIQH